MSTNYETLTGHLDLIPVARCVSRLRFRKSASIVMTGSDVRLPVTSEYRVFVVTVTDWPRYAGRSGCDFA